MGGREERTDPLKLKGDQWWMARDLMSNKVEVEDKKRVTSYLYRYTVYLHSYTEKERETETERQINLFRAFHHDSRETLAPFYTVLLGLWPLLTPLGSPRYPGYLCPTTELSFRASLPAGSPEPRIGPRT